MKIKCDICNGDLMIHSGNVVSCVECGMLYSIERIKEKMNISNEEETYDEDVVSEFSVSCLNRIVIDRLKLKKIIYIIDQYENVSKGIKIYPHKSFRKIFYENEILKLKENEKIIQVEGISKKEMQVMHKKIEQALEVSLKLMEIKNDEALSQSKDVDFILSTDNDEEREVGSIKEYVGDASIINVPNGVEWFGGYCDSIPVFKHPEKVKKVNLGNSISSIGSHAFKDCCHLKEITIPSNVEFLGYSFKDYEIGFTHMFDGCIRLESVVFDPKAWNDYDNCKGLFKNCVNLKQVTLPNTISSIPESTFEGCENLEEIVIPERVCVISKNAFKGCKKLKKVHLPKHGMIIHPSAFIDTLYVPPSEYVKDKIGKRCAVCNGKIDLWHTCKTCGRQVNFT